MAKCVQKANGEMVRVSDKMAEELVYDKGGMYIDKTTWKESLKKGKKK